MLLLPGRVTRKRALIVLISPIAGLVALAAIDLTTAHGTGHYTGSVLHAHSAGEIRDIIVRRYRAACHELIHGAMPFATALALLAAALGVRRRRRLLAPVDCDPALARRARRRPHRGGDRRARARTRARCCSWSPSSRSGACSAISGAGRRLSVTPRSPGRLHAERSRALRPSAGPAG